MKIQFTEIEQIILDWLKSGNENVTYVAEQIERYNKQKAWECWKYVVADYYEYEDKPLNYYLVRQQFEVFWKGVVI